MKTTTNFENIFQLWQEYSEKATIFANYDKTEYPIYGLDSEIGELYGKYAKYFLRGDKGDWRKEFVSEFGDCLWMLSEIDRKIKPVRIFNRYHIEGRDFPDVRLNLLESLCDKKYHIVFDCLLQIMAYYNIELEEVLDFNIQKLTDRKNRNVIKGEGDNR